ncbi:unnamed protein product [Clonostachys chloroleuca]|uniref:Ubiquitin-related modifier 1 n=1 Tax=Clonostachys chloroleuca TaxID=1926264 RepID=A0AA35QE79_9HYPO|nr:unnamed protein product [Clonostachys chloroleuca]
MGPPGNAGDPQPVIPLKIEFSGGLEILFADERHHSLSLPALDKDGSPSNIGFLINYLCENLMKDERKELFVLDDHLRPGILVLINDADWELEGEESYELQPGDNILFVSTLHGGPPPRIGVDWTPVYLCITYNKRRSGRQLCCMVKMQLKFQPRKHNTAFGANLPANHLTRFIGSRCLKHES